MERGGSRLHRASRDFQRRGRPLVLGCGADVSYPGGHAEGPAGTACLRRSGGCWWHRRTHLFQSAGLLPAPASPLPRWTWYIQPPIAGLIVGAIAYFGAPQVMGPGYNVIDQAMHGQFTWKFLLALALLKIVATTISFSSGTPGGMFAPTLFIGAMLGASIGTFEKIFFPSFPISVGSYALVGMGVLFAAFLRVPLTSVFMVLEVSGNYSIVLPVILANTIAYLVSRACSPIRSLKPSPTRMASTCLPWRNSARRVCCIWRTPCAR